MVLHTPLQLTMSKVNNPEDAHTAITLLLNIFVAFSGFLIPTSSIPAWWIWMFDISFVKYGVHFISALEAKGETYTCQASELVPVDPATYNQWWQCSPSVILYTPAGPMKCPFACGKELLDYFGVKYSVSWEIINFAVLHSFIIFFIVCNFLAIKKSIRIN